MQVIWRSSMFAIAGLATYGCRGIGSDAESSTSSQGDSTSAMGSESSTDTTGDSTEEDGGFLPKSDLQAMDLGAPDSHAEDMQPIWNANCILYCHATGLEAPAADLDLFDGAYANLVDQPSGQLPTMMLVAPGEPENSYLWHKLLGTHLDVGGEGDPMPATGYPLDDDTLGRVEAWILAGAPP